VNGLLCEVKSAESLAAKLAQMLDMNGDERRAMGERGREKVTSEFDERMVVERYKELLQTLTGVSL
jgi:glycosyltransferase involved in cell wall biosynthesis